MFQSCALFLDVGTVQKNVTTTSKERLCCSFFFYVTSNCPWTMSF